MTKPYSVVFKQKMVQRLTGKNAVSASELARETGVRQQNLSRWLEDARSLPLVASEKTRAREWTVEQKAGVLAGAADLTGEQLSGYLAREGVRLADFESWRLALDEGGRASASTTRRIRQLERELARKEKALAEAAALLVLKKSGEFLRGGRARRHERAERQMMLAAIAEAQSAGARLAQACRVIGLSIRTIERWRNEPERGDGRRGPHHRPHNALSPVEEAQVVSVLTSSRFAGLSPKQLVPQLADEGLYLASESTIYRLQRRYGLRASKRAQSRTHVTRACTIHRASRPNQVWSWDITLLPTTVRGVYLRLYLVMDIWSRRIVGWRVSERESAELAAELVAKACRDGNVGRGLVLHSDNGAPMRGNAMIATLQWLGVVPSFSRPHVSDDNAYSEALFRTLKYTPAYPRLPFADIGSAERWVASFVAWYNGVHRHSGIRYVTPDERHYGKEQGVLARRQDLYERARQANPERWSRSTRNWSPVGPVVLNPERVQQQAAA